MTFNEARGVCIQHPRAHNWLTALLLQNFRGQKNAPWISVYPCRDLGLRPYAIYTSDKNPHARLYPFERMGAFTI